MQVLKASQVEWNLKVIIVRLNRDSRVRTCNNIFIFVSMIYDIFFLIIGTPSDKLLHLRHRLQRMTLKDDVEVRFSINSVYSFYILFILLQIFFFAH